MFYAKPPPLPPTLTSISLCSIVHSRLLCNLVITILSHQSSTKSGPPVVSPTSNEAARVCVRHFPSQFIRQIKQQSNAGNERIINVRRSVTHRYESFLESHKRCRLEINMGLEIYQLAILKLPFGKF